MAFGRGKVILLGEHGVVYGNPAIAAGLDLGVRAHAAQGPLDEMLIDVWGLRVKPSTGEENDLSRAFAGALSGLPSGRPPLEVRCDVELPAGAGLGCSAALGIAVIRAIDEVLDLKRSPASLQDKSLQWERVFHGNPSGIDNAVAAHGGVIHFSKETGVCHLPMARPLHLVIAHSGEASSTAEMVSAVARQRERDSTRVDKVFEGIGALVLNAQRAIADGDHRKLGQLLDLNHALLASLLLSTPRLEALVSRARADGARGAKVTGAGGGGCMLALVDEERVEHIRRGLVSMEAEVIITEVSA
jgi:mevalonate kinase